MSPLDGPAAAAAGALAILVGLALRRRVPEAAPPTRGARFLLWLAIASPLLFLLSSPADRPRVLVAGRHGTFEALRLLAFAAAAAGLVATLLRRPRRAWSAGLLVLAASLAGLAAAVLAVTVAG